MNFFDLLRIVSGSLSRNGVGRLQAAAADLTQLISGTEKDFLTIGEKLGDFYSETKAVARLSSAITERMVGSEVTQAMEELQRILDRVGRLDGESGRGRDILIAIQEKLTVVRLHLEGFRKTVRNLHVLCNFIKIESARCGRNDTGFETLSQDVKKLAEEIESQTERLLNQSTALLTLIQQNIGKFRRFEDLQHRQAGQILSDAVGNLAAVREKHGRSTEALRIQSSQWDGLSRNVAEVVSSVQFHDITRQRFEHVRDALQEVMEQHRTAGQAALVADTCELQAAQLRHARDELVEAVETMIGNTRNIVRNVQEMTQETEQLVGGNGSGRSFFAGLEGGMASIVSAVSGYAHVNRELSMALSQVTGTVEQMSSFVSGIEKIGLEMKMVALNAAVHAAHIGDEGLGLGVLADALHPLSMETSLLIDLVSGDLHAIIASSREASDQNSGDATDSHQEMEGMADRLQAMMAPLHRLDADNLSLLADIRETVRKLSLDVEESTASIQVHKTIDQEINRLDGELQGIVAEKRSSLRRREAGGMQKRLHGHSARYTMDKERVIHDSILEGAPPATRAIAQDRSLGRGGSADQGGSGFRPAKPLESERGPAASKQDDALGDNVELF